MEVLIDKTTIVVCPSCDADFIESVKMPPQVEAARLAGEDFVVAKKDWLESLQEENKRLRQEMSKIKDKAQIFASHCAVQFDRGGNVGSPYAFEKSQELYDIAQQALKRNTADD